jgi:hypothetical protein
MSNSSTHESGKPANSEKVARSQTFSANFKDRRDREPNVGLDGWIRDLSRRMAMSEIEQDNIAPPPHYREDGPPQVVTSDTARQGPLGSRVLLVLVASIAAAAIIVGVIAMSHGYSH